MKNVLVFLSTATCREFCVLWRFVALALLVVESKAWSPNQSLLHMQLVCSVGSRRFPAQSRIQPLQRQPNVCGQNMIRFILKQRYIETKRCFRKHYDGRRDNGNKKEIEFLAGHFPHHSYFNDKGRKYAISLSASNDDLCNRRRPPRKS